MILISLFLLKHSLATNYTNVRNLRQVLKVMVDFISIPAVNMKVIVIPVNTVAIRQQNIAILKGVVSDQRNMCGSVAF